jgi:hypothetical protein
MKIDPSKLSIQNSSGKKSPDPLKRNLLKRNLLKSYPLKRNRYLKIMRSQ